MEENRKSLRRNWEEDVYIELTTQDADGQYSKKVIGSVTVDVSREGVKLYVNEQILQGTVLNLCMNLGNEAQKLYLTAEVKWSRALADEGWYYIGFEIYEGDNTDYDKWHKWVEQFLEN